MPISITTLVKEIDPSKTILLFGAGASLPSGAPSVNDLMDALSQKIGVSAEGYAFDEFCSLVEQKADRKTLIKVVREKFRGLKPTRGLLNIPLFDWNSIYTTNYDDLLERSYSKKERPHFAYSSNFDFGNKPSPNHLEIFKLHGTIHLDLSDGHHSRIVLTTEDNEVVEDFREHLYDKLKSDLAFNNLIILGYSLSDRDLSDIIKRAISLRAKSGGSTRIYLLMYSHDDERAGLYEARGLRVAYGGVDDFVGELTRAGPEQSPVYSSNSKKEILGSNLIPITQDVQHSVDSENSNISRMFNGGPASFADIKAGFTFARSIAKQFMHNLEDDEVTFSVVLGASGVGKTTLARQVLLNALDEGKFCWSHLDNNPLLVDEWRSAAGRLRDQGVTGVLFVDDAHNCLFEINQLSELLSADKNNHLKIILCSSKNLWGPRLKSVSLLKAAKFVEISKLDRTEIDGLISLTSVVPQIVPLVEKSFSGFSLVEKRRRLQQRCEREFFVCLKNIFSNESFDDIVLREFAEIPKDYQTVYKTIAALESMGIIVHRQLVLRLARVDASQVVDVLSNLDGVVEEYLLSKRGSLYGWRGRHLVISGIITRYKYDDVDEYYDFMEKTVTNLLPSYDCEIRSMKQLCSGSNGIDSIPSTARQNKLLRIMMSNAPGQRVPRHRLIRNLISSGQFEDAETEIRLFAQDIGNDGPIERYKIRLLLERAINSPGLMDEDRAHLLNKAVDASLSLIARYGKNKQTLQSYGNVAVEIYRNTGDYSHFDDAMDEMKALEQEVGDPEITSMIARFDRKISGTSTLKNGLLSVSSVENQDE